MNGGIGQFARVLDATMADHARAATIDTESDSGAWQRELIHSPTITCGCCGGPAHACAVYADARAEQEADSATGDGDAPYSAEHLS